MNYKKTQLFFVIACLLFCLVFTHCKDEAETKPAPEITSFEVNIGDTLFETFDAYINVRAKVNTGANINELKIEINPIAATSWAFDTTYQKFTGISEVEFNEFITIPFTTDSCQYTVTFTVTDSENQTATTSQNIFLIYEQAPIIVPFNKVNGFIIDATGTKLLATNVGLFSFDEAARKYNKVESNLELLPVTDLAVSPSGNWESLWIGSNNGVLNIASQTQFTESNSDLLHNTVNQLSIDKNNALYCATPEGISINKNNTWHQNFGLKNLYSNFEISDIGNASNGFTYACTKGGGVERFKLDVDGISGATVFDTDWSQLRSNNVLTVFIDDTIQAYGTDYGAAIHYSEYTKWDWETFTTEDGLISDTVLSIVKDYRGAWWFGTSKGLSKFFELEWTNYTVANNGFISDTIKYLAIDTDGTIWFACDKGLSHLKNDKWINY